MARVLVVGSGIAGLATALHAAAAHEVVLVTKGELADSNTRYAQGGIAAATAIDDSAQLHADDTIRAGAGLTDEAAARLLATDGAAAIRDLIEWGVLFDRGADGLEPERALEAAHSRARVLHAGGDATGAAIEAALVAAVRKAGITLREHTVLTDLVLADERVVGVEVLNPEGVREVLLGDAVVLATGGAGQLYAHTTNPAVATGDGLAAALRAGVATSDLEFYQFHPTTLAAPGNFLISEAVRGEGAVLRNAAGERFMLAAHPDAELAPRDVVARAIAAEMARQGGEPVVLDARGIDRETLARRFPTIMAACSAAGYDLASEPVPVTPAAHYYMGGITTDLDGRTSLPGLFAVGEVACTGVHGANRLASNSLLEGVVFARRVAAALAGLSELGGPSELDDLTELNDPTDHNDPSELDDVNKLNGLTDLNGLTEFNDPNKLNGLTELDGPTKLNGLSLTKASTLRQAQGVKTDDEDTALRQAQGVKTDALRQAQGVKTGGQGAERAALQALMWEHAGLTRSGAGLALAAALLREWAEASTTRPDTRASIETANLLTVAQALVAAAEARRESRGAHSRSDFPQTEPIATREAGRQLQTQGH